MLRVQGGSDEHDIFKKRCALAASGSLTPEELSELRFHLDVCEECQEIYHQYRILTTQGVTVLAEGYGETSDESSWQGADARKRLLTRVMNDQQMGLQRRDQQVAAVRLGRFQRITENRFVRMVLAAGLILAVASGT